MKDGDETRKSWVVDLPTRPPQKVSLARVVDAENGSDPAENSYYEAVADPSYVRLETARRRFADSFSGACAVSKTERVTERTVFAPLYSLSDGLA